MLGSSKLAKLGQGRLLGQASERPCQGLGGGGVRNAGACQAVRDQGVRAGRERQGEDEEESKRTTLRRGGGTEYALVYT